MGGSSGYSEGYCCAFSVYFSTTGAASAIGEDCGAEAAKAEIDTIRSITEI